MAYSPTEPRDYHGRWTKGDNVQTPGKPFKQSVNQQDMAEQVRRLAVNAGADKGTVAERQALENYISNKGYKEINGALRAGLVPKGDTMKLLDGLIARSTLTQDIVVYRGVGNSLGFRFAKQHKAGEKELFTDPSYVSSSLSKKKGFAFSPHVMEIHIPKGAHVLPIATGEAEVLMPRGSRFQIRSSVASAPGINSSHTIADFIP